MLRTTKKMKEKYEKIQSLLFSLIPEKWEAVYLYASVVTDKKNSKNGELFFYYIPKGLLKKKPVNVYEVPRKFNINENQYLEIVKELYDCIKELKQDFIDTEQDLWTNLTISIENFKFKVEYGYEELPLDEQSSNKRHIVWRYKYLKLGGEKKEEQKILSTYFYTEKEHRKETYETGLYLKTENNNIMFDKEDARLPEKIIIYEKENETNNSNKVANSNILNEKREHEDSDNKKNQILNM